MAPTSIPPEDPSSPASSARAFARSSSLEELWPPFGLRIDTPRLALRVVRETDFPQYLAAASSGVTHTDRNPFAHAWNEKSPQELVRASLPWLWSSRAEIGPESWMLMFGVFLKPDGGAAAGGTGPGGVVRSGERLIGMQDCSAAQWSVLQTITSGSWLRSDVQGRGYGREMRAGMVMWAVDHFGAQYAESGAYEWNERSRRVSLGLGYEVSGRRRVTDAHGQSPEWEDQFRLAAEDLVRPEWSVQVAGSERLREFFAG